MLRFYILNVGHGDSIVVEHFNNNTSAYGVVDSNRAGHGEPAALKKLRELGAEKLSFVALTHPHADHYQGLLDILQAYSGRVEKFFSFPLDHKEKPQRLKRLAKIYQDIHNSTDSSTIRSAAKEYIKLLVHLKEAIGFDDWVEYTGPQNRLFVEGFDDLDINAIMPLRSHKGSYFQMIETGSYEVVEQNNLNMLSMAMSFIYRGTEVVLGGDVVKTDWIKHRHQCKYNDDLFSAHSVKLPHHGANDDCDETVLKYLFAGDDLRTACISANGRSHPHPKTLARLERMGIKPYCTNLAETCGAEAKKVLSLDPSVQPELMLLLNRVLDDSLSSNNLQPCQGDIEVTIDERGVINTTPQLDVPCPYRGDYATFRA